MVWTYANKESCISWEKYTKDGAAKQEKRTPKEEVHGYGAGRQAGG